MKDVAGKTAFITGGASGMGLAMARSFAGAGMKVAIADIEQSALQIVADEFSETNATVITIQADVSDLKSMSEAARETTSTLGNVHVLVNNAGVVAGGHLAEAEPNDWRWQMNVNLDGVFHGLNSFLPDMLAHGEPGHVVNTASLAGHMPVPRLGIYAATKFAVVGLSETLRAELAETPLGVSVLCPGVVATNIFNSSRNRPDALHGTQNTDFEPIVASDGSETPSTERLESFKVIEPAIVGDMVLHAIQNDQFYIFTHPEFDALVSARSQEIASAFDYWRSYVEA